MTGRRVLYGTGATLVAVGLVLLGYVAWQMYGTTVVSERKQVQAVEEVTELWEDGRTGPRGAAEALVRIPAFGDDYVMPVFAGTSDEVLTRGFGRFDDAAAPGEPGNYSLAAHRVTHGQPLRDLPKLDAGDEVVVETRDAVYVYRLVTEPEDLVVDFSEVWVLDPLPVNPRGGVQPPATPGAALLTLTTCSELFNTDNRMVAFAALESSESKT